MHASEVPEYRHVGVYAFEVSGCRHTSVACKLAELSTSALPQNLEPIISNGDYPYNPAHGDSLFGSPFSLKISGAVVRLHTIYSSPLKIENTSIIWHGKNAATWPGNTAFAPGMKGFCLIPGPTP
eukprot:1156927-Pelagomonas_calceolata.AAC.5